MKISTVIEYFKGIGFGLEINAVPEILTPSPHP
jgi:hypothetical protein